MSKLLPKTLSVFVAMIVVISPLLHTVSAATFSNSLASGTFTNTEYDSGSNSVSLTSQDIQTTETKNLGGGNIKLLAAYEDPKLLGMDKNESVLYIGLENEIVVLDTKKTVGFEDDVVLGTYSDSVLSGFPAGPYNELTVSSYDNIFIDAAKDVVIIKKSVIGRNGTDTTNDDVYYGELGTTGWYRNIVQIGQDYLVTTNDTGIKLIQTHGTPTTSDDTILNQYSDCAGGKFCVPTSQPMGKVFYDDVADIVYIWGYNPNIPGSTFNAVARNGTLSTDDDTVSKAYYGPTSTEDGGIVDFTDGIIFSGSYYADGQTLLFDTKGNHDPSDDTYTGFYHSSTVPGVESTTSNRMLIAYSNSQDKFIFTGGADNQLFGVVSTANTPALTDDVLDYSIKSSDISALLGVDDKGASFSHTDNSYEIFYDENTELIYAVLNYNYTENEQTKQGKSLFAISITGGVDDSTTLIPRSLSVTNQWQEKTSLDIGRTSPAFGVINNKLYVVGGTKDWADQETLEIYNYDSNQWSYGESLPESRVSAGSIAIGEKLYVLGGRDSTYTYLASVYVYDSTSDTWAALTPMPTARVSPAVAHVNGKIYVMGGTLNGNNNTSILEIYDIANDSWSTGANMPHTRSSGHTAAVSGSKIYVTGGAEYRSQDPYDDSLFIYDTALNTWSTGASMPKQVAGTASVVFDGKWYVIGGTNNDGDSVNSIFEYNFQENSWVEVVSLPSSRHRVAAGIVDNGLLIAGGRDYDWDTSDKTYWLPFENIRDNLSHFYFKSLSWVASTPAGTSVEMKYTLNGGQSYLSALTSGAILPQNKTSQFAYKPRFLSTNPSVAASISSVTATYVRYATQGEYLSTVFGGEQVDSFTELQTTQTTPIGTEATYYVRTGNTSVIDGSWSDWAASTTLPVSGKKYAQVKAVLTTNDLGSTPQIQSLSLQYTEKANIAPTNTPNQSIEEEEAVVEEETGEEEKLVLNNYQEYLLGTGKYFELKQKQTIYFLVENEGTFQEHSATVTEVGEDYVQLMIASTPVFIRISVGEQKFHDVDDDGNPDIAIKLNGIEGGLAKLTFAQVLSPSVTPTAEVSAAAPTQLPVENSTKSASWIFVLFGLCGAGAILFFVLRRQR